MADGSAPSPVDPRKLAEEQAGPTRVGLRSPWSEFDVAGFTPSDVAGILDEVRQGQIHRYHELAEQMLERDPELEGHFTTLKAEIDAVDLQVLPATDETGDLEKAELLRTHVVDTPRFRDARFDLLDGLWHGFAALEMEWDTTTTPWTIAEYEHRPQRWFIPDRARGRSILLRTLQGKADEWGNVDMGEPLIPRKWVVFCPRIRPGMPSRSGLAMPCVGMHVFASYAWRFWMGLAEGHGHPMIYATMNDDKAAGSQRVKLKSALKDLGHRARAVLPAGSKIEALGVGIQGLSDFHDTLMHALGAAKAVAIFGSNMMSEEGGSLAKSQSLGERLQKRRDMYVRRLDQCCNEQVAEPWCDNVFGDGTPGSGAPYPKISGQLEEPEDSTAVATALLSASKANGNKPLPVVMAQLFKRLGWDQPEEGDKLFGGLVWENGLPIPDPDAPELEADDAVGDGDGDGDGDQEPDDGAEDSDRE